ncbi:MAG: DNA topoisomerase 3 [Sphaerochaetaceae bacterium]|nr:DNA topoisomerase 3 [Sphaerochaetaceae bacterium]
MSKKLVLAEKPSVARSLAKVLGAYNKAEGYLEGSDYIVTWALGHLVELSQPAFYSQNYRRWSFASLPILPESLKVEPIERTIDQFKIVKSLIERDDVDTFIIATDAGREGELVARWILELSSFDKKVERLWISSQTDQAIKEGFQNLKDGDKYLNLYKAAYSRAAADWYVGINVTRALTTHYDAKMSAGRVQTPTLYLMCEREEEIEKFSGKFYWTVKGDFEAFNASYYPSSDSIRIDNEEDVEKVKEILDSKKEAIVSNIDVVEKTEQPPLAYDLTELQRDANLQLSFSAKKTLDVLQRLYEYHKIVTYPRTDSRYITSDIVATLDQRLKALVNCDYERHAKLLLSKELRVSDRFVRDELVSDHHAIIPTEQRVNISRLSEDEKALWSLIVKRFLEVLEQDYIYQSTTMFLDIDGLTFKTRVTKKIQDGWKSVGNLSSITNNESDKFDYKIGQNISLKDYSVKKLATEAPSRYNEATLLSAMEHAGRYVDDASLKKNLTAGLGTPATRADIIEKLIHNNYIIRTENNELMPTAIGREIIRLAPPMLKSPALTGKWEERLNNISKGKEDSLTFINDIKKLTKELVKNIGDSFESFTPDYKESKKCPYCDSPMMKVVDNQDRIHFICQKLSCSYEEMEVIKKVPLSKEELAKRPKVVVKKVKKVKPVVVKPKAKVEIKEAAKVSSSAAYFQNIQKKQKPSSLKPSVKKIEPAYKIEKVIEVVRESKLRRNSYKKPQNNNWQNTKYNSEVKESGSTFADFIKASENRHKKRKK